MRDLGELTTHCIHCGLCLEACPTFLTTASETESPRGRIHLVRGALDGDIRWQEDVRPHIDRCLGCLACTTACPSGVQYGSILELARERLERERPQRAKSALLTGLTNPTLLKASLALPGKKMPAIVSRLLSGQNPEAETPRPQKLAVFSDQDRDDPVTRGRDAHATVYLLEGCAMRVLFPRVHQATRRLLARVGYAVREVEQGCCGALHAHAGHLDEATKMGEALSKAMSEDIPIVVNSAGCGSTMKHIEGMGRRVFDASEFLFANGLIDLLRASLGVTARATYHDACHLAHGQGIRTQPRELIAAIPGLELVELPEADTCCGSAGTYNVTQPALARALVERKWRNVESTGASIVATGNPGCHAWIAQAAREHGSTVRVLHTMELLEAAFSGLELFT